MPADDITLYAGWTINQYTITFDSNGGSSVDAITDDYGESVSGPTNPTREGYTFGGWYSDSALTTAYTFTTIPADDITLYAAWTINQYTITFDSNGGSSVDSITEDYGTSISASTDPTRTGYTFDGWHTDEALTTSYTFTTMPAENLTLYAKWTINEVTITFDSNGGSSIDAITDDYGEAVSEPSDPTKEGHTFDGWYTDEALTTAYTFSTMPAEDLTLYAKWDANAYTITYEKNGGVGVS